MHRGPPMGWVVVGVLGYIRESGWAGDSDRRGHGSRADDSRLAPAADSPVAEPGQSLNGGQLQLRRHGSIAAGGSMTVRVWRLKRTHRR
jgi:hypothetical protein